MSLAAVFELSWDLAFIAVTGSLIEVTIMIISVDLALYLR